MSLSFTSTDKVDFGAGSSLISPLTNAGTIFMWVYLNTLPPAASGEFLTNTGGAFTFNPTAGGNVQLTNARATQSMLVAVTNANMPNYAASKWCCIAASWDLAGANGNQQVWSGDLTHAIAEASAYAIQRVGSGAATTGANAYVGNNSAGALPLDGKIAFIGVWNRRLSLAEMLDQQFRPHVTSGCVLFAYLGFNGTSTQPDWSGNGNNGTVTGTTQSANVPLGPPFGFEQRIAYAVAAGGSFQPAWARGSNQLIGSGQYV